MKKPGQVCSSCRVQPKKKLIAVTGGAIVCPRCDCLHLWPPHS